MLACDENLKSKCNSFAGWNSNKYKKLLHFSWDTMWNLCGHKSGRVRWIIICSFMGPLQPDWLGLYHWRKLTYTEGHTQRCKYWLSRNPQDLLLVNALRLQKIAYRRVRFHHTSVMAQTGFFLIPKLNEFSEASVTPKNSEFSGTATWGELWKEFDIGFVQVATVRKNLHSC